MFLIVLHIVSYGVYRIREFLAKKLCPKRENLDAKETQMSQTNNVEIKGYINEGMAQESA